MTERTTRLFIAAAAGLFWGWIVSRYILAEFSSTSPLVLIPWGIMGVTIALLLGKGRRSTFLLCLVYGEALTISFSLSGAQIHHMSQIVGLMIFGITSGVIGALACFIITILIRMLWQPTQKTNHTAN